MAEKFVFEDAMKRLEEIVGNLERGDAPLDKSLALFEEGTKLIGACDGALQKAEQKLKLLVKNGDTHQETDFKEQE